MSLDVESEGITVERCTVLAYGTWQYRWVLNSASGECGQKLEKQKMPTNATLRYWCT